MTTSPYQSPPQTDVPDRVGAIRDTITVALLGNPNTGKSTLFNALAGVRQRVGNYPGVTVEKKMGRTNIDGQRFDIVDLPGTYSLAPRSPDEMVTVDVLLGRRSDTAPIDAVVCIVDASNLERNLYLVSQVLELGLPTVIALNMMDVAAGKGLQLDVERLRQRLGLPVVEMQANRRIGLDELRQALVEAVAVQAAPRISPFPEAFRQEVAALEEKLRRSDCPMPRYLVERVLLDTGGYLEDVAVAAAHAMSFDDLRAARGRLAEGGFPVPAVEAMARYKWVGEILEGVVVRPPQHKTTLTDRIDHVLTHKLLGTAIFAAVMAVIFQAIFAWAEPLMGGIEWLQGLAQDALTGVMAEGTLQSLLVDGVIAGVGGVLVFLPQILILFLFIAVLEDCGYMARAAYLMDKLMSRVGLSGKSFIPLLSSFACAIPGIMAARVIENRRDRLATILVAPLMSCSARLPVYTLLIAAFIPATKYFGGWVGLQGLTFFAMYLVGIVVAVVVALLLKKTLLRGETPPFVMELPSYKLPSLRNVAYRVSERGWAFVRRAGTLIFAASIVVWAAAWFPHNRQVESQVRAQYAGQPDSDIDHAVAGAYLRDSYLGRAGHWVQPLVRPLGWDWKIGCAVIASFPAREVVIGTMGVIYNLGGETDEESQPLRERLHSETWADSGEPVYNIPVALSIMVFFALCAQCVSTLVIIRRETASWRWPIFTFVYMTVLAYVAALVTYQVGIRLMA